jgi:hypothetical protein
MCNISLEEIDWRQEEREIKGDGGEGCGDAVVAGDKQLGSCAAGKRNYTARLYANSVVTSSAAALPEQKKNN